MKNNFASHSAQLEKQSSCEQWLPSSKSVMQTMMAAQRRVASRKRNPWSPRSVGPRAIRHTVKAAPGRETREQKGRQATGIRTLIRGPA